MRSAVFVLITLAVLSMIGCATSETAVEGWQRATRADTVHAYRDFLDNHPGSAYDARAKARLAKALDRQHEGQSRDVRPTEAAVVPDGNSWTVHLRGSRKNVVLRQGMSLYEVEAALGTPITAYIPSGPLRRVEAPHLGVTFDFDDRGRLQRVRRR